ncbi:MAG TPA: DUF4010 domain-containing protein, partial [Polyangiaceae bacterium]
ILGILAPIAILASFVPFFLMIAANTWSTYRSPPVSSEVPNLKMESPFSIKAALKFGLIFVALQIAGTIAERLLGGAGFYLVSLVGGLVSSASAVASAAMLCSRGELSPHVGATGAVIASIASAVVNLPLVSRISDDRQLTRRLAIPIGGVVVAGVLGIVLQRVLTHYVPLEEAIPEMLRRVLTTGSG